METCWVCGEKVDESAVVWVGGDGHVICCDCDEASGLSDDDE